MPSFGGSTVSTSKPAPAMVPFFSASASAASSTSPPRAVLMRMAVGFIFLSSAAPIMFLVCGVSGTCKVMMSLSRRIVSKSTRPGCGTMSKGSTFMPSASARLPIDLPMRAIADDAERRAGDVADRVGQEAELARLVPHAVPHVLDIGEQVAAEREDQREHMLGHGVEGVVADIDDGDAVRLAIGLVDHVGAGRGDRDQLQLGQLLQRVGAHRHLVDDGDGRVLQTRRRSSSGDQVD